jgi:hypothetical protein
MRKASFPIPKNVFILYLWSASVAIGAFIMGYFFVIVSVLSSSFVNYMDSNN